MDIKQVYNLFFSPTDSTRYVLQFLSEQLTTTYQKLDLTHFNNVEQKSEFTQDDLIFIGAPSYAGRLPDTFVQRFKNIQGNNALAILVVTFGNRAQEDTLIELFDTARQQGFRILAAAEVVTEHSIIHDFGKGRPDIQDKSELMNFMQNIKIKLQEDKLLSDIISGNRPYKEVKLVLMAPQFTVEDCVKCGKCVRECPPGAINEQTFVCENEKCISCLRCIKVCPMQCRFVDTEKLEKLRIHLTPLCSERKVNKFYL